MNRSKLYEIDDNDFKELVINSNSIVSCKQAIMNAVNASVHTRTIKKRIAELGLSTSHFLSKTHQATLANMKNNKEIFCKGSTVSATTIRNRILKEELLPYMCAECGLTSIWNNKSISLQLDHIDGDTSNNVLTNLRFLCPNCHSQTKTWGARNIKFITQMTKPKKVANTTKPKKKRVNKNSKRPPKAKLQELLRTSNFSAVGRLYGVSDNAVRKWCVYYNMSTISSDYH